MTVDPSALSYGMELEVTGGADALAESLYSLGCGNDTRQHNYHCGCNYCDQSFDRSNPWTYQGDPTVDGEFITKPFIFGEDDGREAIAMMGEAVVESRATVGANGMDAGNHVHVVSKHLTADDGSVMAALLLERLVVRYQPTLNYIAQAGQPRVRGYNGRPHDYVDLYSVEAVERATVGTESYGRHYFHATGACGDYVRVRPGSTTTEFRLWNATRSAWRMQLHADLSVAMMAAACNGVNVTANDERPFIAVVGEFLPTDSVKNYNRQLRLAGGK